ncbi:MAG: AAA family ATPase [Clostridiales Family XIII bacterium]|jgi:ABC-type cobalamin/Fe3+-siderophores transport system ATPase subunit|nr:AAA family ATPase [Clostridiales Family XIII bacterium]
MELFLNGAEWLRADFHLHTRADGEFKYSGEENCYNSAYADALENADIRVGAIANHNKFDMEEFKALRNTAKKKNVFLLPGVELSVNEGANGIHTLVVFDKAWIEDGDRISPFLTNMFPGKTPQEYQNENGRSDKNILQTVEELDKTGLDYFLLFAHVERSKGLWKETGGGKLRDWNGKRYRSVKERTLGFQQVRTRDCRERAKGLFGDWYPAEVEGSDPKSIADIGRGKPCYVKLGAFTFEAVKFALVDHENRIRLDEAPKNKHSHIRQISFEGGTLDGKQIRFSAGLNTLIGIRGSGKSSILEALRYVLDIRIEAHDSDREYKQKLVERTLGSGGRVVLDAMDRHGQSYQIRRILKESANVFVDDKLQPGVSIRETVLSNPLFFGQKELASAGKDSEKDLIEKLLGVKCDEVRRRISEQKTKVAEAADRLSKVDNVAERIAEQTKIKQDAEFRLKFYKDHNLEEKLQKRLGFEADIRKAEEGISLIGVFIEDIRELLAKHEDDLRNFPGHLSVNNAEFFTRFDSLFSRAVQSIDSFKTERAAAETVLRALKKEHEQLIAAKNGLADEFAAVERTLAEELKTSDGQNISTDEFLISKKKLTAAETALAALSKSSEQKFALRNELYAELQKLNALWYEEFQIIKAELDEVSRKNAALAFSVGFKEDKAAFRDYFKTVFKGSNIRDATFQNIVGEYQDFAHIYSDFEGAKKLFGSNPDTFANLFEQNLKSLLTYQTPNKFTVTYRGTELAHHSLGQRASALILFVLGQRENDVILIDQPEDDLDNQTIYEDVIKLIRELKPDVQFVFATHNPNIPVLGDAEQIHACSFADEKITVQSGALDDQAQQKKIVDIMEGGKEAFERRKEIYQIWKS